ncbi:hypothetical protein AAMO2058_000936300 [Amorphochlora amoebiformis]|mmetsp:Transcript_11697/g.18559  ORF Transcript_11697/g.18559 Transcript_11697/m.18559 type:complete len:397 (-) Transcript_11697:228-1418(-)
MALRGFARRIGRAVAPRRAFHAKAQAELLELSLTLDKASVGDNLENPYEITITEGIRDAWHGCFYQHDRLYTSDVFATKLGFKGMLLPFSFLLHTAGAVSHADDTRKVLDVAVEKAVYERPSYLGDTIRKEYYIQDLRTTSDGKSSLLKVKCALLNQDNERVFSMSKTMLFIGTTSKEGNRDMRKPTRRSNPPPSRVLGQISRNSNTLSRSNALARLYEGQLILHSLARPIGTSMSMILSTMFRMTHPSLFNTKRFGQDNILVPGGVMLSQVHSCCSRGLYEILYEELTHAQLLNPVSPMDVVGAISYVHDIKPLTDNPELEEVTIQTWGIKGVDVAHELKNVELPVNIFGKEPVRRSELDAKLKDAYPDLCGKVVSNHLRRLVRQSPRSETMFLL